MSAVTRKLATCFPELKSGQFSIQYQDEEGDKILVTNDADLAEALAVFKALGRVLSFSVLPKTSKSDESEGCEKSGGHEFAQKHFLNHWRKHWQNQRGCHERHGGCGRRWHRLAHMLGMRPQDMKPQMQNMMRFGMLKHFCGTTAVHHGITCDGSNQNPLLGVRYHKIGHNYDLNATEFAKLSPTEQNKYAMISRPGAPPVLVTAGLPAIHHGVVCDGSNQNPLLGVRYHKIGHNYDLNATEFAKLSPIEQNKYVMISRPGAAPVPLAADLAIHHGVVCDGSNQNPLLGVRYHKIGHNYDLNATEFAKLSPTEQNKYVMISRPGAAPVPVATALPTEKTDLDCKFFADATIPDHAVVPPQQHFEKKWIVKTGPKPWPAGCVLTHVGGHPMGTKASKAKPAPLGPVPANAEVELAVVLKAPKPSRDIISKWRVCTPDGRQFGDFLWALINVEPLKSVSAAELPPAIPVAAAKPVAAAAELPPAIPVAAAKPVAAAAELPPAIPVAAAKPVAAAAEAAAKTVAAAAKAVAKPVAAAAKAVAKTLAAAAKAVAKPVPVPVATTPTKANESANLRKLMEMNFPVPTEVLAYILESTGDDLNAAITLLLTQSE